MHYGLVDYHHTDWLGIRAGRVRTTMGLYNETRDIDMLRSSVWLPQAVYPETSREYYASADAVALYGTFDLKSLGTLSYQIGSGDLVNDEDPASDLTYTMYGIGASNVWYENGRSSHGQLLWDTPIDGLRTGYTWRRIDNIAYLDLGDHGNLPIEVDDYVIWVLSGEYTLGKLVAAAEYSEHHIEGTFQSKGWYGQLGYELSDKLSGGVYYGDYTNTGFNGGTQDTWALFAKYNITDYWLVKAELDFNKGNALYPARDRDGDPGDSNVMFAVKTTFYF